MSMLTQTLKRNWLWSLYFVFVITAIISHDGEAMFSSNGPYASGKLITWAILIVFLLYSLKISLQENFFKSLGKMKPILWTKQIGLDLYIGLLLPLFIIFLNEGSLLVMLIWLAPVLLFANLATLLYVALNYDSIIRHFI